MNHKSLFSLILTILLAFTTQAAEDGIYVNAINGEALAEPLKKPAKIDGINFIPYSEMVKKGYGKYMYLFVPAKKQEIALLAGGCYWGVQELFRTRPGVIYSEVGYTGGDESKTMYEDVHTGTTGHAEAVRIIFDPKVTSYTDILLYFFNIHDPTTLNRQGNDVGTQYRSDIFYLNKAQKETAEKVIARVDKSKNWKKPVITKITEAKKFIQGEEHMQDYLQKHPGGYTCHFPRGFKF